MIELRDYQQKMIDLVIESLRKGKRRIMIVLPTGGGKTAIASELVRRSFLKNKSSIFMCHRQELLDQTYNTYSKNGIVPAFIKGGRHPDYSNPMQIASVNTLIRRLDKYKVPDIMFVDECFVRGTKVETINGKKNIEEVSKGDFVLTLNEKNNNLEYKKVLKNIKKERKERLLNVFVSGNKITCTENHLFFTKKGWTKAKDLCINDMVLTIIERIKNEKEMRMVRSRCRIDKVKEGFFKKKWICLVSELFKNKEISDSFKNNVGNKQEICFRSYEKKQSDEKCGSKRKGFFETKNNGAQTKNKRWKWAYSSSSEVTCNSTDVGHGVCGSNKTLQGWKWISNVLQNRYSKSNIKNRNRSRWWFSLRSQDKRKGFKKGTILEWSRVENCEIFEQGSNGKCMEMRGQNIVYDLTVKDNHNYFVENVLVHNCHHSKASQWNKILDWADKSVVIGLTATPCRLDGKPLNDMYETMLETVSTKDLINSGYLVPYLYYAPSIIDTSELVSSNGDYTKKSLEEASFNSKIIGDNIEQYKKIANGKRNVVFAISRKHGIDICERYKNAGVAAEFLDGETSDRDRKNTLDRFRSGETHVLINVDLFGEGFDLPAIEVVSLLRPTQSTALYLQQVGRALRPCPELGKQRAIILDHVNNYRVHGMPDEEREWSLSTEYRRKRKTETSEVKIKRCPNCFFAHSPSLTCPNCGYKYVADGKTIKEVAGELCVINSEKYDELRKKEIILANSFDDLVKIEKQRNYKFGWAEIQYKAKTGIDLKSSFDGYEEIARARGYNHSWAWVQWQRVKGRL